MSLCFNVLFPFMDYADSLLVAVQQAGKATSAKVVHANNRSGEEEGDPGHDDDGLGPSVALVQLPAMERPQDCV